MTRHIVRATNDSSSPPAEVHIVHGAETSHVPMLQAGSLDYVLDEPALHFLADLLTQYGYAVRAPGDDPPAAATDGSCGHGWCATRDGQPVTHICVRRPGPRHGRDHVCACYASMAAT